MELASVEVIPYALPFREPYTTARGTLTERRMALLRVRDEDGVVGLGEAVPLSLRGGVGLEQVVRELEAYAEHRDSSSISAPARCAVETALMDLRGRRTAPRAPAGGRTEAVACNATLTAGPPEAVAAQALEWAADGFTTFKLKLGAEAAEIPVQQGIPQSREGDVEQVRAVREAVGPMARIRIDVNETWDLETAKRVLGELEQLGIELAEQPVAGLEAMAELAAATSVPLAADESVTSAAEAERAAALGACEFTGVKLSKVGGPEEALAISELLPTYVSSSLDGPVGIAAGAQVALSLTETGHSERLELAHGLATQRLFASSVAAVQCELRDGLLQLPPGPGLGVEIDEEALQAHRL